MSIKFRCPHCEKALSVKDELGGKKGTCPGCKKIVLVPVVTPVPTNGAAPPPLPPPLPTPVDVEAEAAAILGDKPPETVPQGPVKTIDFNCPMCDEPIQLPLDLCGKNEPCPSCRRIIKVPLAKKLGPIDWKNPHAGVPSLARVDVPAVEGAWGNTEATRVSQEALEEAGALPVLREPVTAAQWMVRILLLGAVLAFMVGGGAYVFERANVEKEEDSLQVALAYMTTDAARQRLGPEGLAELHRAAGQYYLRTRQENCAQKAKIQFDEAFNQLGKCKGLERDLALTDLVLARLELGGSGDDLDEGRRFAWEGSKARIGEGTVGVAKVVGADLAAIGTREARLEALRPVIRRLIVLGEAARVYGLTNQAFGTTGSNNLDWEILMEARGVAGLELLAGGHRSDAEKIAARLEQEYAQPKRPPLAASAVVLIMVLERPPPAAGKGGADEENQIVARSEGRYRKGETAQALEEVELQRTPKLKLWAQVGLANAALDANRKDGAEWDRAFEWAVNMRGNTVAVWHQWRLLHLGLRAGVDETKLKALVEALPEGPFRARAQLLLFKARLTRTPAAQPQDALQLVPDQTLSRALAHEALARHNIGHDRETSRAVLALPDPNRAFGCIGVSLGLQER